MSERHTTAELVLWAIEPTRRWRRRCSPCQTWRLVADYVEGYLPKNHGWFWVCSGCMLTEISNRLDDEETPACAPWGEWGQSTATGFNNMHGRRGMPDTAHVKGTWPAHKCELCAAMIEKEETP